MNLYATSVLPLYDDAFFNSALPLVSDRRRERALAYRYRKDQALSICVELLLLHALRTYANYTGTLEYYFVNENKPAIKKPEGFHFNMSHSGEYAVCAVSFGHDLGVDIEKLGRYKQNLAERCFTSENIAVLNDAKNETERIDIFYKLWVMKESFMKATGEGFNIGLNDFSIDMANMTVRQSLFPGTYRLKLFDFDENYRLAVCSNSGTLPALVQAASILNILEEQYK